MCVLCIGSSLARCISTPANSRAFIGSNSSGHINDAAWTGAEVTLLISRRHLLGSLGQTCLIGASLIGANI